MREHERQRYLWLARRGAWHGRPWYYLFYLALSASFFFASLMALWPAMWCLLGAATLIRGLLYVISIDFEVVRLLREKRRYDGVAPLTSELLDSLVRRRKRIWIFQIAILVTWAVAWAPILAASKVAP